MAWVMQCDKCKTIFEHKEGYRRLVLRYFKYDEEWTRKNKDWDLCSECMKQVLNFVEES